MSNVSRSMASVPGYRSNNDGSSGSTSGNLDTHPNAPASGEIEQVDDNLETLGHDVGRQRPCHVVEIVDAGQVDAHREPVVVERLDEREVLADRGVDDLVERAHPWLAHAGFAPSMTGAPSGTGT